MVAIKDMEMPNNCSECGLKSGSYCYFKKPPYNFNGINILNERASGCPLVEIEERKVGKWIYKKLGVRTFGIVCSSCNRVYHEGQNIGSLEEFKKDIERIMRERNITLDEYCCHCGAEMVGVENGTTNN